MFDFKLISFCARKWTASKDTLKKCCNQKHNLPHFKGGYVKLAISQGSNLLLPRPNSGVNDDRLQAFAVYENEAHCLSLSLQP